MSTMLRASPSWAERFPRVAVLGILAIVVLACSSNGGAANEAELDGVPLVRAAVRAPGTELQDGFVVAKGSWLLGAIFPAQTSSAGPNGGVVEARGWRAVLLVTGDVEAAVSAYREQAANLGVEAGENCSEEENDAVLACRADAFEEQAQFSLALIRRRTGTTSSHLVLTYLESVRAAFRPLPDVPLADSGARSLPLPRDWTALPKVGDEFGADPATSAEALRLAAGSELIAPVGEHPVCNGSSNWIAVLRVKGAPRRVMREYAEQIGRYGFDTQIDELSVDRVTILRAGSDESGNGLFVLEAVIQQGVPGYMRVERCAD